MSDSLSEFNKSWNGKQEPSISEKIKNIFKQQQPLRHRLVMANYKVKSMVNRLDVYVSRMQERDRVLFERVVEAQMSKDTARAAMYANEIAEIRKITKQLIATQIALEQVSLRLETVTELGDIYTNLVPVVGVIRELRTAMKGMMPEFSYELEEVEEGLQEVIIEAGEFTGGRVDFTAATPEARKILEEAATIAEQKMKESFPELPSIASTAQKSPTQQK